MRNKFVLFVVIAFMTMSLAGCTTIKILARGNKPLMLNQPSQPYEVISHFSKETGIMFDYTGAPDVTKAIQDGMAGNPNADGVANIFISVKSTVTDFILNLFTLGFANAYTLQVEGDVIKYKN
jgi:hypothetical protein